MRRAERGAAASDTTEPLVRDALAAICAVRPDTPLTHQPEHDRILLSDGEEGSLFLGNLRTRTGDMSTAERQAFLAEFVQAFSSEPTPPEALRESLALRLRTVPEVSLRSTIMEGFASGAIRPCGDLMVEVVHDMKHAVRTPSAEDLKAAGLSPDEAFEQALHTLTANTPSPEEVELWEALEPGVWALRISDDFAAARVVMLPGFPLPAAPDSGASPTLFLPSHNTVVLTHATDREGLERAVSLGNQLAEAHRFFSARLFKMGPDGPVVARDTEVAREMDDYAAGLDYAEQADALDRFMEDEGREETVPTVMGVADEKTGAVTTLTVFAGGPCWLPEADAVALKHPADSGGGVVRVEWSVFARTLGTDAMPPVPGLVPVRYAVPAVTEAVFAALLAAGEPMN